MKFSRPTSAQVSNSRVHSLNHQPRDNSLNSQSAKRTSTPVKSSVNVILANTHSQRRDTPKNSWEKLLIWDQEQTLLEQWQESETTSPMPLICSSKTEDSSISTLPSSLHQIAREPVKCSKSLLFFHNHMILSLSYHLLTEKVVLKKKRSQRLRRRRKRKLRVTRKSLLKVKHQQKNSQRKNQSQKKRRKNLR